MQINRKYLITGASVLISVIIFFVIIFLIRFFLSESRIQPMPVRYQQDDIMLPRYVIDLSDYIIPEEYTKAPEFNWIPYRQTKDYWTREEADRFWADPAEIIRDMYSDINKKELEQFLEDIP